MCRGWRGNDDRGDIRSAQHGVNEGNHPERSIQVSELHERLQNGVSNLTAMLYMA
jgi:hypothetical protein